VRLRLIGSDPSEAAASRVTGGASPSRPLPSVGAVAVSIDERPWCLVNAPAGLGLHLRRHPELATGEALTVVLTDAQLDHVSGLLALRHGPPIDLHATPAAFEELTQGLPLLQVIEQYCGVRWHLIGIAGDRLAAPLHLGDGTAVRLTALAATGAAPRYSSRWGRDSMTGDAIALLIDNVAERRRLLFVPGPAALTEDLLALTRPDDELVIGAACSDLRQADAREPAAPGTVPLHDLRARYPALGRVVLQADTALAAAPPAGERTLGDAGIELAFDGAEFEL